jgi:molecular chaperone HtpG
VLSELDCEPLMRQFDPVTVPALYVMSHDARTQDMVRRSIETSDELWSDVLSAFVDVEVDPRPKLVFNWRHPLIRRISGYPARPVLRHAVEALYGQALLAGHHPLRAADTAALNRSFLAILDRAFAGSTGDAPETELP